MAVIAKGMITLVNVNDAYSVTVTPSACAIKADFDGSNPILDEAYCDISVVRGDVKVPFTIASTQKSNNGITFQLSANGAGTVRRMALTAIPSDVLSGNVTMNIETEDEFVAQVVFQYSVTREATMLDWIQDWETNKTTIGNTYMITPKIFVGKRENTTESDPLGELTGVYIGPSDIMGGNVVKMDWLEKYDAAVEQAVEQGVEKAASKLLSKGKTVEEVAELLDMDIEKVQEIEKKMLVES